MTYEFEHTQKTPDIFQLKFFLVLPITLVVGGFMTKVSVSYLKTQQNQPYRLEEIESSDFKLLRVIYDMLTEMPTEPLEITFNGKMVYSSVNWWYHRRDL